jgi:phosphohistidine phosphatase
VRRFESCRGHLPHRLLLLRHAKSSWDDADLPDRERPLSDRGRKAAAKIGRHLREQADPPDLILCSPARRTRETLERLELGDTRAAFDERLYGAAGEELLEAIRQVDETAGTLLVIAHDPGLQDLATDLAGADEGEGASRVRAKFPTAALAVFETAGAWSEVGPETARLVSFVVPRGLP